MIKVVNSILSNDAALTAKLGGATNPRIYALKIPQTIDLPAITMQTISNASDYCVNGLALDNYRIQVNIWAVNAGDLYPIADLVKAALNLKSGLYAGVSVREIRKDNEGDLHDKQADILHYHIDFKVTIHS